MVLGEDAPVAFGSIAAPGRARLQRRSTRPHYALRQIAPGTVRPRGGAEIAEPRRQHELDVLL